MDNKLNIILFGLTIVIIACVFGSLTNFKGMQKELLAEHYENDKNKDNVEFGRNDSLAIKADKDSDILLQSDRLYFFKIGLANFFTKQNGVSSFSNPEFVRWIKKRAYFWPNNQDICCKSLESEYNLKCNCGYLHIADTSSPDPSAPYMDEAKYVSIQSITGPSNKDLCSVTVLENDYIFLKRSIILNVPHKIEEIGIGNNKKIRLHINGHIPSLVLSRPLFISFNNRGLFQVLHEDFNNQTQVNEYDNNKQRNIFAFYDSTKRNKLFLILKKVPQNAIEGRTFYTKTNKSLVREHKPQNPNINATIYYLNYRSEIKAYDSYTHTINLLISDTVYNDSFKLNDTFMFAGSEQNNTNFISTIGVQKSPEGRIIFLVDDKEYRIPEEFRYHDPQVFRKFHICFTLTYDILLIHCLGIEKNQNKNVCYAVRHHLSKRFKAKKSDILANITENIPEMDNIFKNKTVKPSINVTCIPNYAILAQRLGYNFNVY